MGSVRSGNDLKAETTRNEIEIISSTANGSLSGVAAVETELVDELDGLNFMDLMLMFVIAILSCAICIGSIIGIKKYNQMRRERDSAIIQRQVMHKVIEKGDTKTFSIMFGIQTKFRKRTRGSTNISMERVESTDYTIPTDTNGGVECVGGEEHHDDDGNTANTENIGNIENTENTKGIGSIYGLGVDTMDIGSVAGSVHSVYANSLHVDRDQIHQRLIHPNHGHEGLPLNVESVDMNIAQSIEVQEELEMDRQVSKELFGDHHERQSFVSTLTGTSAGNVLGSVHPDLPREVEEDEQELDERDLENSDERDMV